MVIQTTEIVRGKRQKEAEAQATVEDQAEDLHKLDQNITMVDVDSEVVEEVVMVDTMAEVITEEEKIEEEVEEANIVKQSSPLTKSTPSSPITFLSKWNKTIPSVCTTFK